MVEPMYGPNPAQKFYYVHAEGSEKIDPKADRMRIDVSANKRYSSHSALKTLKDIDKNFDKIATTTATEVIWADVKAITDGYDEANRKANSQLTGFSRWLNDHFDFSDTKKIAKVVQSIADRMAKQRAPLFGEQEFRSPAQQLAEMNAAAQQRAAANVSVKKAQEMREEEKEEKELKAFRAEIGQRTPMREEEDKSLWDKVVDIFK